MCHKRWIRFWLAISRLASRADMTFAADEVLAVKNQPVCLIERGKEHGTLLSMFRRKLDTWLCHSHEVTPTHPHLQPPTSQLPKTTTNKQTNKQTNPVYIRRHTTKAATTTKQAYGGFICWELCREAPSTTQPCTNVDWRGGGGGVSESVSAAEL